MANWKKVIVSGSQASLAGISGSLLTDGKLLFGKGSEGAVTSAADVTLNAQGHIEATFSGSASGSFEGDGSGLTGVVAQIENSLVDGGGIQDFTFDGSAEIAVSVDSGSLAGTGLVAVAGGSGGINVSGLTVSEFAAASIIDSGDTFASALDDTLATTKAVKAYVDAIDTNLPSNLSLDTATATEQGILNSDGTGVTLPAATSTTAGLLSTAMSASIAANSLKVTNAASNLSLGTATTTTQPILNSDGDGVTLPAATSTTAGLLTSAEKGEIADNTAKVSNIESDLSLGTATATTQPILNSDGDGVTLVAATSTTAGLLTAAEKGEIAANSAKTVGGTANEIEVTEDPAGTFTVGLPDDVTIGNDLTVTGDLLVQGDTTSLNTTNLNVEDQFILLNSGSNGADIDTGIIFGGSDENENSGKSFYYDAGDDKFGFSTEIAWDATSGTLSQYVGAIEIAAANPVDGTVGLQGVGTTHVNTSTGDIFIYV